MPLQDLVDQGGLAGLPGAEQQDDLVARIKRGTKVIFQQARYGVVGWCNYSTILDESALFQEANKTN